LLPRLRSLGAVRRGSRPSCGARRIGLIADLRVSCADERKPEDRSEEGYSCHRALPFSKMRDWFDTRTFFAPPRLANDNRRVGFLVSGSTCRAHITEMRA
jgi:hypothetical protein